MLIDHEWEFGLVLPNLVLPYDTRDSNPGAYPDGISIAPEYLTIAPGEHPVVESLRASSAVVEQILSSFHNEYGKPYKPAVLLVRKDAAPSLKNSLEAIVAFRNAIAIAAVLPGRAAVVRGGGSQDVSWSDTFDFHPAQIGGRGGMILQSPAILSWVSPTAKMKLTHSPNIGLEGRRLWVDHYLFRALGKAWQRKFAPVPKTDAFGSRLFRSLEAANQACAVGAKNEGSVHDYGIQLALWVSACEILAWAEERRANLPAVLSLLARYNGRAATMKKRYRKKVWGKTMRLTAAQRSYSYLYDARNVFLHGEPVGENTMLTRSRTKRIGLPRIAALVYRSALVAYLAKRYSVEIQTKDLQSRAIEMFAHHDFEEGFAEAFGYDLSPRRDTLAQ